MNSKQTKSGAMQALLEEDSIPSPPQPGSQIQGEVVSIQNNRVLVEIDNTYTGIIAGKELIDGFDTAKKLMVGDEVNAVVVEEENEDGYYVLSIRKMGKEKAWDKLAEMMESGETLEVPIKAANKGGLMSEFSGIKAFIPVSQLTPEHYPRVNGANSGEILARLQKYVGEKFTVQVLAADQNENKLIFSEKAAINKKRDSALRKLKVGDKVKGKVSGIVNFGIFILFNDCLEGLVHLSEIAWGKVTDPANYARLGEEKEAVVIGFDENKISLSIRRLTPDPWMKKAEKYKVGDIVEGEVGKITSYGALVDLSDDVSGILHTSEIAENDEELALEIGDKLKAKIIEINPEEHRIALSIKELDDSEKPKKKSTKKKTKKEEDPADEEKAEKPKAKKTTKKKEAKEEKEEKED